MSGRERLRATLRLLVVAKLTAFFLTLTLLGRPLTRGRRWARWRAGCFRRWSRSVLAVLGAKVETSGPPPATPFVLVANHLSYVDVLVLASRVDCSFVAKSEVASWPVVGTLTRAVDTLFVDRRSHRDLPRTLGELERRLAAGDGIVLFPEGTSTEGARVRRFHSSLLAWAAENEFPVAHAALGYETAAGDEPAHLAVCWWGDMAFPDHFYRLCALSGFRARVVFGDERLADSDRKRLATALHAAVAENFVPVVTLEEACV